MLKLTFPNQKLSSTIIKPKEEWTQWTRWFAPTPCKRRTRRWPLVLWYNLLDVANQRLHAYPFTEKLLDNMGAVANARRLFIKEVGKELVIPQCKSGRWVVRELGYWSEGCRFNSLNSNCWYPKCNSWYQKFELLISKIRILDIQNSNFGYQEFID